MSDETTTLRADSDRATVHRTSRLETAPGRPAHALELPAEPPLIPDRQTCPTHGYASSKPDSQLPSLAGLERPEPATTVTPGKAYTSTAADGPTAVREHSQEMEAA